MVKINVCLLLAGVVPKIMVMPDYVVMGNVIRQVVPQMMIVQRLELTVPVQTLGTVGMMVAIVLNPKKSVLAFRLILSKKRLMDKHIMSQTDRSVGGIPNMRVRLSKRQPVKRFAF